MTLDDARTLLGIDAAASQDEARRAYLRLVKKHRPEQDPAGFQRVREAYDIVRHPPVSLFDGAELLEDISLSRSASSSAEVEPVSGVEGLLLENVSGASPDASLPDASLERFRERAAALDDSDTREAIKLWRTAVREHPASAEARWALVQAYDEAGDEERAARVLLRGYRRGLDEFGPELLARAPGSAPAELFEGPETTASLLLPSRRGSSVTAMFRLHCPTFGSYSRRAPLTAFAPRRSSSKPSLAWVSAERSDVSGNWRGASRVT